MGPNMSKDILKKCLICIDFKNEFIFTHEICTYMNKILNYIYINSYEYYLIL